MKLSLEWTDEVERMRALVEVPLSLDTLEFIVDVAVRHSFEESYEKRELLVDFEASNSGYSGTDFLSPEHGPCKLPKMLEFSLLSNRLSMVKVIPSCLCSSLMKLLTSRLVYSRGSSLPHERNSEESVTWWGLGTSWKRAGSIGCCA